MEELLSKKERRFLKRQQKEKERLRSRHQRKFKKFLWTAVIVIIIGGGISALVWFLATRPSLPESEIVSRQSIHWHADLSIKISGQYQDISANIGIGFAGGHRPIHTHETDGVIHMEFPGLVKKDDIKLGRFFEIWGKKFSKDCIFDKCSGPDGQVKMLVNEEPNYEFENYLMQDKDRIEIIFE